MPTCREICLYFIVCYILIMRMQSLITKSFFSLDKKSNLVFVFTWPFYRLPTIKQSRDLLALRGWNKMNVYVTMVFSFVFGIIDESKDIWIKGDQKTSLEVCVHYMSAPDHRTQYVCFYQGSRKKKYLL